MAATTTTLSGSYLDNWQDFKEIFTSTLDPDGNGRIGSVGKGSRVQKVERDLDRLDQFFNDNIGAELKIFGPGVPSREDFIKAVDPDGDGAVGTGGSGGRGQSLDRALGIYDNAFSQFTRNSPSSSSTSSTTLFGAPESIGLGVEATTSQGPKGKDAVIFGGAEPTSRFSDLVGSEPQVLSSPDILDIGGQTEIVDPFANDPDQIDLFKNKG